MKMDTASKLWDEYFESKAVHEIQEWFRHVRGSLALIDYGGIFELTPWIPDYGGRNLDVLPQGTLALDLWECPKLEIAGAVDLLGRLSSAAFGVSSAHAREHLRYIPVDWILVGPALAPPHGLDVLNPPPPPPVPAIPSIEVERAGMGLAVIWAAYQKDCAEPSISMKNGDPVPSRMRDIYEKECAELAAEIEKIRGSIAEKIQIDEPNIAEAAELAIACGQGDLEAIGILMLTILRRHPLPGLLAPDESKFALDVGSRGCSLYDRVA
jgi:hypothetical protein